MFFTDWIFSILRGVRDLLFPPLCLQCQILVVRPGSRLEQVCPECLATLRPMSRAYIQRHLLGRISPCYLDDLWIAFEFSELIRQLVHCVKYRKMGNLGCRVGEIAASEFAEQLEGLGEEFVIVPIPLHPGRERERTYNQSERLARGMFAQHLNRLRCDLLTRGRQTGTQTRLDRRARIGNVSGAFQIDNLAVFRDRVVLLVDDVVTTGATLNECARILKQNGAGKVIGVALASPVLVEE
ncbi:MAG TPA: phosphoribosyltransferase family protein [Calditrichia bacterium]|nr:ComF family protein [Calditrichota bacterium]HQU70922.1 phosphoribosyltransferase family protein [Calditrichia bacterium]HQV30240.1 phosphoribosyltransferase family protein [Calditrichia bacterium]